jgi:hypothetical protein
VEQVNITSNFFGRPNYVYQYSTKKEDLENNFKVFSELVTSSGQRCEKHKDFKYPEEMSGLKLRDNNIFYRGVPKEKIVKFLSEFRGASGHSSQPGHIVKSLRKTEYVTDWTVMVANLSPGPDEKTFPCDLPFALRPLTRSSRVDDMYSITREEKFSVKQISEGTGGDRVADVVYDICDSESSNTEEVSKAYARWLEYARNESGSKMIKEDGTVKFSLLNRCREKNSGLLLLYPFRAKDCDGKEFESEFPFIGVSVMLGEVPDWKSSTAEYMVNPTLDNQSIEDQEENDGDTTNE